MKIEYVETARGTYAITEGEAPSLVATFTKEQVNRAERILALAGGYTQDFRMRVRMIQVVRWATSLGLREAKDLVEFVIDRAAPDEECGEDLVGEDLVGPEDECYCEGDWRCRPCRDRDARCDCDMCQNAD